MADKSQLTAFRQRSDGVVRPKRSISRRELRRKFALIAPWLLRAVIILIVLCIWYYMATQEPTKRRLRNSLPLHQNRATGQTAVTRRPIQDFGSSLPMNSGIVS